jgi:hypothetical protein
MITSDIVKEIAMTTRFYLRPNAKVFSDSRGSFHKATLLPVHADVEGNYIHTAGDPYDDPLMCPRNELRKGDVASFSCVIHVTESVYLTDDFQTGNYSCDQDRATILVGKKDWHAGKSKGGYKSADPVFYREMTVTTSTWEELLGAISKICNGEITPVGKEQTVLEIYAERVTFLSRHLNDAESRILRDNRLIIHTEYLLSGKAESSPGGVNMIDPSRDKGYWGRQHWALLGAIEVAKVAIIELAEIKATWWYKLIQFFCLSSRAGLDDISSKR